MHVNLAWLLVSWWPHVGLHRNTGEDNLQELLYTEYGFHVTLMIGDSCSPLDSRRYCAARPLLRGKMRGHLHQPRVLRCRACPIDLVR